VQAGLEPEFSRPKPTSKVKKKKKSGRGKADTADDDDDAPDVTELPLAVAANSGDSKS